MPNNLRLNLRQTPRGGEPIDIREITEDVALSRRHLIILVHGYNVSRAEAGKAYETFERNLAEYAPSLAARCCWAFWPGDARLPVVRTLAYPFRLQHAIECAPQLAEFLRRRRNEQGGPTNLVVIGHSLGCRLVLEALSRLQGELGTEHGLTIRVALLAAAVPFTMVRDGGALRDALRVPSERVVFFSPWDTVLNRFFAPGQLFAGDGTDEPLEAVGSRGLPSLGIWSARRQMYYHGHGDYWKSRTVAQAIAYWLGAGAANPIVERGLDEQFDLFHRDSLADRALPGREWPRERPIGGRAA